MMGQEEPQDYPFVQQVTYQEQDHQGKEEMKANELAEVRAKIFATIEREDKDLFTLTRLKHVMCEY